MAEPLEPEWDCEDSNAYQDGREQAQADARSGEPYDDRAGRMPRAWTEGYQDEHEADEEAWGGRGPSASRAERAAEGAAEAQPGDGEGILAG